MLTIDKLRLCTILALCCAGGAGAHEIGTSRVAVLLQESRTFDIEIVTDAVSLGEKIQAMSGKSPTGETDPAGLQALFTNSDGLFRGRVKVVFDGTAVRPAISYSVVPGTGVGAAAVGTIRLTGDIPAGARQFAWTYSWTFASYALTIRTAEGQNPTTQWLEGGQSSTPVEIRLPAPPVDRITVIRRYLTLGFTHIVPYGLDHMLFVLGIYLLSGRARSVLCQVSAFTVAHSITLGLSMYGLVTVSSRIVEPMIALSIAYVAIENVFLSELKSWRIALVFSFGLLHGMGFAGALKELGLPRSEFLTALLTFNVGVEAGQLAVIGAAFLIIGWHWSNRSWYRSRIVVPASAVIACTAVYWTIERLSLK